MCEKESDWQDDERKVISFPEIVTSLFPFKVKKDEFKEHNLPVFVSAGP